MTADQWQRVKRITSDALERPESERASWLAEACAGDEELFGEVSSLLTAHAEAGEFLETPRFAPAGAADATDTAARQGSASIAAGRAIGPYRIIRELGEGGMGVVYLAERADAAFERKVAIKVVRGGFAGGSMTHRFQDERRILATLDHPNIASLLDAGTTEDGLPYLVMEYVDGVPLDAYCEAGGLSPTERLALFRQVCAAVQYAHQRLVIHRDLKAHNILVAADGTPKLLDFGIAKLLEPGPASEARTLTAFRAFTLDAASPEQIRGEPMTVTSEVYSLGVLLYRLLAGQSPYGPGPHTDADLVRVICEETPPRPSAVAPIGRGRELRGELDWIVLKALRKEPERRYASVEQLDGDLGRHLGGRPVVAAPDSWRYRARKFLARNRMPVVAGVLLTVSLLAGLSTTLWQARRAQQQRALAERRFNDVRQLASAVVGELHDAIKDLPGATAARQLLVTRALQYLDGLAGEAAGDESLLREMAGAYLKIGDAQGNPYLANLGDPASAQRSYQMAFDIYAAQAAAHPADLELQRDLAQSHDRLANLLWARGENVAALERYRVAMGIYETLASADPARLEDRYRAARELHSMGQVHLQAGDTAAAGEAFRQALARMSDLVTTAPHSVTYRRGLATAATKVGDVAFGRHDYQAAMASHRQAERMMQQLARENPASADLRRLHALTLVRLGIDHSNLNRHGEAVAMFREMVAMLEALAASDPQNVQVQFDLVAGYTNVAQELASQRDYASAASTIRRAVSMAEQAHARNPGYAAEQRKLPILYRTLGDVLIRLDAGAGALDAYRRAVSLAEAEPNPRLPLLAESYQGMGDAQARLARAAPSAARAAQWEAARRWYEKSLKIWITLRHQGKLPDDQIGRLKEVERALARCAAAIDAGRP